ncbi:hypothetical protein WG66_014555 [Moniliophthora roreri]|nr:hypothetical protein WG66_014555 [Moniliophthora roreri]
MAQRLQETGTSKQIPCRLQPSPDDAQVLRVIVLKLGALDEHSSQPDTQSDRFVIDVVPEKNDLPLGYREALRVLQDQPSFSQ